jgi:hypothetical protein
MVSPRLFLRTTSRRRRAALSNFGSSLRTPAPLTQRAMNSWSSVDPVRLPCKLSTRAKLTSQDKNEQR